MKNLFPKGHPGVRAFLLAFGIFWTVVSLGFVLRNPSVPVLIFLPCVGILIILAVLNDRPEESGKAGSPPEGGDKMTVNFLANLFRRRKTDFPEKKRRNRRQSPPRRSLRPPKRNASSRASKSTKLNSISVLSKRIPPTKEASTPSTLKTSARRT